MDEKPLSVLWQDFEINVGRFLLNLWRNFRVGLSIPEPIHPSGGQSNAALIALMQSIEREIQTRREHAVLYGYTTQEVADALTSVFSNLPQGSSIVGSIPLDMPEECSFTQYNEDGFALVLPVEEQ